MPVSIREAQTIDAAECGRIIHSAFAAIAAQHNFPPDFPSAEVATGVASTLIAHPGFYGVVAEIDGRIVGSNFLDERSPIGGIGPITIDPSIQNKGIGRQLMQVVMERAAEKKMPGIRLLQDTFHNRSLCLYISLGFVTREPISVMQGPPLKLQLAGYEVRPATSADIDACNAICRRVHGFARGAELKDAIARNSARLVERLGRITGYATDIGFFAHAVAESNDDLKALIGAVSAFAGPGFLLPTRNDEVFRWCLDHRLRLVKQQSLMTIGLYSDPDGAYLPSILY
jgi:predicted N-acetyltransferase YhbS